MSRLALLIALPAALLLNTLLLAAPAIAWEGFGPLFQPNVLLLLALAGLFVIVESAVTSHGGETHRPAVQPDDAAARRLAWASGSALVAVFWAAISGRQRGLTVLILPGAACFAGGILLRASAARRLGRFFRTEVAVSEQQHLVATGIYRHLRHPSETGLLLIGLGAGIMLASGPAIFLWALALVPLTLSRIALEERCLQSAFGPAYREYSRNCAPLIPRLF